MALILGATTPIFLIIAIGFLAARLKVLTGEQFLGMGLFVMRLALPALILHTFSKRPLSEIADTRFLLVYALGTLGVQLAAFGIYRGVVGLGTTESAVRSLGMSSGNSGFVAFPIVYQVVGAPAGIGLALCMLVENILLIPLALALAEAGSAGGGGPRAVVLGTAKRLARTPLLVAIVLGFAISASGLHLPEPVSRTLGIMAGASAPLALLVIGGSLAGLRVGRVAGAATQIVVGKLVVLPIVIFGLMQVIRVPDPALARALVIYSASPMLSIFTVIGQRFGLGELTAASLLGATVGSFATISLILWLLATYAIV